MQLMLLQRCSKDATKCIVAPLEQGKLTQRIFRALKQCLIYRYRVIHDMAGWVDDRRINTQLDEWKDVWMDGGGRMDGQMDG